MIPTAKRIYGLIGYPVTHSLSALMHNAAFARLAIPAEYRLFEIAPQDLEAFLLKDIIVKDTRGQACSSLDIAGFNVTIPHKIKTNEILGKMFPLPSDPGLIQQDAYFVKLTGAVNTVKREKSGLRYWNTDAAGFLRSLQEDLQFEPKQKKVLVIGCGGAGRAVIAALSWKSVSVDTIYVYDSSEAAVRSAGKYFQQFSHLSEKLRFITKTQIPEIIGGCHLLVNASSAGMKENDAPVIEKKLLEKNRALCVYDVVYNRTTRLLEDARGLGLRAAGGLGMLLYQGAFAFELWMEGRSAPINEMKEALKKGVMTL